jgi:hypothetical protein
MHAFSLDYHFQHQEHIYRILQSSEKNRAASFQFKLSKEIML